MCKPVGCCVGGPVLAGTKILIANSPVCGTRRDRRRRSESPPPAGIVMGPRPLNVRGRSEDGTIAAPLLRTAMWAAPITSGAAPNAFESQTRARRPPIEVCTIIRTVWFSNPSSELWRPAKLIGPCIDAVHVPTQCSLAQLFWARAKRPKQHCRHYCGKPKRPSAIDHLFQSP